MDKRIIQEKVIEKCLFCKKVLPEWRIKNKNITCSKKCSMDWHHLPKSKREKIRGRKYNSRNTGDNKNG